MWIGGKWQVGGKAAAPAVGCGAVCHGKLFGMELFWKHELQQRMLHLQEALYLNES